MINSATGRLSKMISLRRSLCRTFGSPGFESRVPPGPDFSAGETGSMIGVTTNRVTDLTGGWFDRAGQELVMAAHPLGPGSAGTSSDWQSSRQYTNNQVVALIRATVIALVLLGVLAAIVLL
ncbi:hypothetical protein [Mycolicibacterium frederiksbergense]|jgi:hypothetical protein|uniref:hypothetical protein n=1 Tax=Mycolicibacterium frederiksbergense TaxID=117567 RepID=UPI00399A1410